MNRIVTALSISALLGAGAIGSLQAGGPPDGGYDTQTRSESQADTGRGERSAGVAPGMEQANEPAAGSMTRERRGTDARAGGRDADGRPDTLFGYPVSYTYPFADDDEVQPERIGGVRNPDTAGRLVSEITGAPVSVAELHDIDPED